MPVELSSQLEQIIKNISMCGTLNFKWEFRYKLSPGEGWFVWVAFHRPDIETGILGIGEGRREFIPMGSTESFVVKTCWLLLELVIRHELMESFHYKGHRIFNPHHTVDELIAIRPISKEGAHQ